VIRGEVMPNDTGHEIDIHVDGTHYLTSLHPLENQVPFNVFGPELGSGAQDLSIIEYMTKMNEVRKLVGAGEK
jgi:hypothetical protein